MEKKNLKEKLKETEKLLEDVDSWVVLTDKGYSICGDTPSILYALHNFIKLCKTLNGVDDELLKEVIDISFITEEELKEKTKESEKELINLVEKFLNSLKSLNKDKEE